MGASVMSRKGPPHAWDESVDQSQRTVLREAALKRQARKQPASLQADLATRKRGGSAQPGVCVPAVVGSLKPSAECWTWPVSMTNVLRV